MNMFEKFSIWFSKSMDDGLLRNIQKSIDVFIQVDNRKNRIGEISDGYHTFDELYEYRTLYNAAFFNELYSANLHGVHKSIRHSDGEPCFGGGWFIVMATLPTGQVSNHYPMKDWDLFKVEPRELPEPWDGHSPEVAKFRIKKFIAEVQ